MYIQVYIPSFEHFCTYFGKNVETITERIWGQWWWKGEETTTSFAVSDAISCKLIGNLAWFALIYWFNRILLECSFLFYCSFTFKLGKNWKISVLQWLFFVDYFNSCFCDLINTQYLTNKLHVLIVNLHFFVFPLFSRGEAFGKEMVRGIAGKHWTRGSVISVCVLEDISWRSESDNWRGGIWEVSLSKFFTTYSL